GGVTGSGRRRESERSSTVTYTLLPGPPIEWATPMRARATCARGFGKRSSSWSAHSAIWNRPVPPTRWARALRPPHRLNGAPPGDPADRGRERIERGHGEVADQRGDGVVGVDQLEIGEVDRQQAVEGVVRLHHEALERPWPRDARLEVRLGCREPRGIEVVE